MEDPLIMKVVIDAGIRDLGITIPDDQRQAITTGLSGLVCNALGGKESGMLCAIASEFVKMVHDNNRITFLATVLRKYDEKRISLNQLFEEAFTDFAKDHILVLISTFADFAPHGSTTNFYGHKELKTMRGVELKLPDGSEVQVSWRAPP